MLAVTSCWLRKDSDEHVQHFVLLMMSAQARWPHATDLEVNHTFDRHQDCSGTSCLHLPHFYPELEVAVFSKTLVPTTRLQSVISNETVTLIFIEATNSKCHQVTDTCFWYSICQPSFISGQTMQETGSTHARAHTHTHTVTLMWLKTQWALND
jgi:hypothetical protein